MLATKTIHTCIHMVSRTLCLGENLSHKNAISQTLINRLVWGASRLEEVVFKDRVAIAPWGRSAPPSPAGSSADPALFSSQCGFPRGYHAGRHRSGSAVTVWGHGFHSFHSPQLYRSCHQETQSHLTGLNKHYYLCRLDSIWRSSHLQIAAFSNWKDIFRQMCSLSTHCLWRVNHPEHLHSCCHLTCLD